MEPETREFTEHRIESRRPGSRRWEFIPSSYSGPYRDRETAERSLHRLRENAPGEWDVRLATREVTVVTSSTPWIPVPACEIIGDCTPQRHTLEFPCTHHSLRRETPA